MEKLSSKRRTDSALVFGSAWDTFQNKPYKLRQRILGAFAEYAFTGDIEGFDTLPSYAQVFIQGQLNTIDKAISKHEEHVADGQMGGRGNKSDNKKALQLKRLHDIYVSQTKQEPDIMKLEEAYDKEGFNHILDEFVDKHYDRFM